MAETFDKDKVVAALESVKDFFESYFEETTNGSYFCAKQGGWAGRVLDSHIEQLKNSYIIDEKLFKNILKMALKDDKNGD